MWSVKRRAQHAIDVLRERELTVVTAESCTAGLIASALSKAKGAGDQLHGGFVAYTKEQKQSSLGVDGQLLAKSGAVNAAVARAMAEGALQHSPAHIALASTGVAGPAPDEDGCKVGTLFLAVAAQGRECVVEEHFFKNVSPDRFLNRAILRGLDLLLSVTQELPPSADAHLDLELDRALLETFPASDPVAISTPSSRITEL
jgi:nicotinamide-nucleotide amidase